MTSNFRSMGGAIVEQVRAVQAGSGAVAHLQPFEPGADPRLLEGVLFVKPEATDVAGGVALDKVLDLVASALERWKLEVGGVSVLGAEYLKQHDIIARHYGVINSISRNGESALAEAARARLQELFGAELAQGARVMGGHEFMAQYPEYTAAQLSQIADSGSFNKLGPGTYATKHVHDGQTVILLNAFHPQQIEHFTAPGRSIVVLAVRSAADRPEAWKALRNEMLGVTDPSQAAEGTLRRTFLERRGELGLGEVNRGTNVVHFSAGPLEGMVETARYFSDYAAGQVLSYGATCFGRLMLAQGIDEEDVSWLASNPNLSLDGRQISAFDATEETDPQPAIETLKRGISAR